MKLLLIAYEFPPSPSPQALRWAYLVRELDALGHEVHVLAPDIAGFGPDGLPELPGRVVVHRTYPGPVIGLVSRRKGPALARQQAPKRGTLHTPEVEGDANADPRTSPAVQINWKGRIWHAGLNWKGRLHAWVKQAVSRCLFPDVRREWEPWARTRLDSLLRELRPDIVVSSHEPATTLLLGLRAKSQGFAWVADLGDPVLAPYTEPRWRSRAHALERKVCERANLVVVTADSARDLLEQRHGSMGKRCIVITQGFDDRVEGASGEAIGQTLDLLYTGSFYDFRRPEELVEAVMACEGVRLHVATANAPRALVEAAERRPDAIQLLGFVGHDDVVALQRQAHVLINIANRSPVQVPGKVYEYLGAGRPVLHIHDGSPDATAKLLLACGRGVLAAHTREEIAVKLIELRDLHRSARLLERFDLSRERVSSYGWSKLAAALATSVGELVGADVQARSSPGKVSTQSESNPYRSKEGRQ